jgi:hypothetical protein
MSFISKYWNCWKAGQILNQSIAKILVVWVWGSGQWGIIIPQQILGITPVGNVYPLTIATVNKTDQAKFHTTVYQVWIVFIKTIIQSNPKLLKFRQGWLNRLDAFPFCP